MMADPRVKALIAARQAKTAERNELTIDMVVQQLKRLGFSDPRKLYDENGNPKPIADLDEDTAAAISGMDIDVVTEHETGPDGVKQTVTTTRTVKVRYHDKVAALVKLGQHLGMWKNLGPKVVQNITINQTVEQRIHAVDAEFQEILGSAPLAIPAPTGTGSGDRVVSRPAAKGRREVGRARTAG